MQMGILESDARWLFQQLLIAVDYCHRLGIANRDIKVSHELGICSAPDSAPSTHKVLTQASEEQLSVCQ
jgi:serine/threonine protein kinase